MADLAAAVIGAAGTFPGDIHVEEPLLSEPESAVPRRSTRSSNKHQRHEDNLRERIYQHRARMARSCICDFGPICQTISAHFAVLKDPRGKFVVLPSPQSPLRAVYCQYLCPGDDEVGDKEDEDDDDEEEEQEDEDIEDDEDDIDDNEGFYVAVHHFHPKVVDKYFVADRKISRPDYDLLPFPTMAMAVDQRRACGIPTNNDLKDRVMSHQLTSSNNIYWIVPSYSFDKTQVDLERATRRYLRKLRGRRRRRSKSSKRRSPKGDSSKRRPPIPESTRNDIDVLDELTMSDGTEHSMDSTWDDHDSLQLSHREPFLPLEGANGRDSPLVSPEPKEYKPATIKDAIGNGLVQTKHDPVPEPVELEKSDSDTAANSSDDDEKSQERQLKKAATESTTDRDGKDDSILDHDESNQALEKEKSTKHAVLATPRLATASSSGRSIFRKFLVGLCCLSFWLVAVEFAHCSGVLKSRQALEMPVLCQSLRTKIKPAEEQIAAALAFQMRRLQSRALHAATVETPFHLQRLHGWNKSVQDRMYEAAARPLRSLRSRVLIATTVKLPQYLQIQAMKATSARARFHAAFIRLLQSSRSRLHYFVTVGCPLYLRGLSVRIKLAGNQALQATSPLIRSLQERAVSAISVEGPHESTIWNVWAKVAPTRMVQPVSTDIDSEDCRAPDNCNPPMKEEEMTGYNESVCRVEVDDTEME